MKRKDGIIVWYYQEILESWKLYCEQFSAITVTGEEKCAVLFAESRKMNTTGSMADTCELQK